MSEVQSTEEDQHPTREDEGPVEDPPNEPSQEGEDTGKQEVSVEDTGQQDEETDRDTKPPEGEPRAAAELQDTPQTEPSSVPGDQQLEQVPPATEDREGIDKDPTSEPHEPKQDERPPENKVDVKEDGPKDTGDQPQKSDPTGKEEGEERGESTSEKQKPGTAEEKGKEKKKKRAKSRDSTTSEKRKEAIPKLRKRLSTAGSGVRSSETIHTTRVFDDTINDMFTMADQKQQGYIDKEDFSTFLQSSHFQGCLDEAGYQSFIQFFDSASEDEKMAYEQFSSVARELILRVYQVQDNSPSDWVQLGDASGKIFWLNKVDGNIRFDPPGDETGAQPIPAEQQEMAQFMHQVYDQLDTVQVELEREKLNSKELTNEINRLQEEMEKTHEALYMTGQTLDETTYELQTKEDTIRKLNQELTQKDGDLKLLREKVAQLESLTKELENAKSELSKLTAKVNTQEHALTEKDSAMVALQQKHSHVTEQLKNTTGVLDAKESDIKKLNRDLDGEKTKVKGFEKHVPKMEQKMNSLEEELAQTKQQLEEKVRALQMTRKQLKSSRDRNLELEKDMEKLMVTKDKLHQSEGEVRTLKSFLVSKTALMEKKSREIKELQSHMMDLEGKDKRRAVILASVLERTARMTQEKMAGPVHPLPSGPSLPRSSSAPDILPERLPMALAATEDKHKEVLLHTKSTKPWTTGTARKTKQKKKPKKAHTLPRLPPLVSTKEKKEFVVPTPTQIKGTYAMQDKVWADHAFSNPQCQCAMCTLHNSMSIPTGHTGLSATTDLPGTGAMARLRDDETELILSKRLRLGDRVIVQIKKTMYDLEPRRATGVVKYIGKVDSEYVDNRIYVGVKLDEPVGNSDGLFKGKRYFKCLPKHGKMVRIIDVLSVLYKSTEYKPLHASSSQVRTYRDVSDNWVSVS